MPVAVIENVVGVLPILNTCGVVEGFTVTTGNVFVEAATEVRPDVHPFNDAET